MHLTSTHNSSTGWRPPSCLSFPFISGLEVLSFALGHILYVIAFCRMERLRWTDLVYTVPAVALSLLVAIGTPSGVTFGWTVTVGHVSATERVLEVSTEGKLATSMTVLQHTAAINPGNSGGPLINMYGQVVGINTLKYGIGTLEGLGFAIPVSHVTDVVSDILEYGYVRGRPMIGIKGADLTAYGAQKLGVPRGIEISFISPGTYAAESDLQVGDIIIGVNGKDIQTMDELNLVKNEHKAGDSLTLKVYRDGETLDIEVKLSEAQS